MLTPGEVHLWRAELTSLAESARTLVAVLSEDELGRAARFRFEKDRHRFIVVHAALRHNLSGYTGTPAGALRFSCGTHGKPSLQPPLLEFSLSHSHELALFAFATRPVGVDVEYLLRKLDFVAIARRYFSPEEAAAIAAGPPAWQAIAFFRSWTRREAFLKVTGRGLVGLTPHLHHEMSSPPWWHCSFTPSPAYLAALCQEGPEPVLHHYEWSPPAPF